MGDTISLTIVGPLKFWPEYFDGVFVPRYKGRRRASRTLSAPLPARSTALARLSSPARPKPPNCRRKKAPARMLAGAELQRGLADDPAATRGFELGSLGVRHACVPIGHVETARPGLVRPANASLHSASFAPRPGRNWLADDSADNRRFDLG